MSSPSNRTRFAVLSAAALPDLHAVDPAAEAALVRDQLQVCETYRERARERVARAGDGFSRLVAQSKLSAADATVDWLQGHLATLSAPAARP